MKHVTLPTDYCMRTFLLEGLVMEWSRREDPLMAPKWPRSHGTPQVRNRPAEGTEGTNEC